MRRHHSSARSAFRRDGFGPAARASAREQKPQRASAFGSCSSSRRVSRSSHRVIEHLATRVAQRMERPFTMIKSAVPIAEAATGVQGSRRAVVGVPSCERYRPVLGGKLQRSPGRDRGTDGDPVTKTFQAHQSGSERRHQQALRSWRVFRVVRPHGKAVPAVRNGTPIPWLADGSVVARAAAVPVTAGAAGRPTAAMARRTVPLRCVGRADCGPDGRRVATVRGRARRHRRGAGGARVPSAGGPRGAPHHNHQHSQQEREKFRIHGFLQGIGSLCRERGRSEPSGIGSGSIVSTHTEYKSSARHGAGHAWA